MIRALIEFLFVIGLAMVGRAILASIFRGVGQASANAFQQTAEEARRRQQNGQGQKKQSAASETASAGLLHKDPMCGTYVSESSEFHAMRNGRTVYFCSPECLRQFKAVA